MKKRTNLLLALLTAIVLSASAQFRPMFDEKYPDVHDPVMANHAYDSQVNARAKLFLRPLVFDRKGWMKLK